MIPSGPGVRAVFGPNPFDNVYLPTYVFLYYISFITRSGYGSRPLEPEAAKLCDLGTGDFLASDEGAESYVALYLKDDETFELDITMYKIDAFSPESRKKEGYLCTLEGKIIQKYGSSFFS